MTEDFITLWTFQHPDVYKMISEKGIAYCDFKSEFGECSIAVSRAYDWMCEQIIKRVDPPESPNAKFPLWAWRYYQGKKKAKPRRCYDNILPLEEAVFMELRIPQSRVLLSDFEMWHIPLNDYPDEKEGYVPDETIWEHIFEPDFNDPYYTGGVLWDDRDIQATFWCILQEDIVQADLLTRIPGRRAVTIKNLYKKSKKERQDSCRS